MSKLLTRKNKNNKISELLTLNEKIKQNFRVINIIGNDTLNE